MKLLFSLNTGIILIIILLFLLIAGAFIMPSDEAFGLLYVMPLFTWLKEVPFEISWWLVLSIGILFILIFNTILCSIDSIIKKYKKSSFLLIVSPQIMHLGFIFIVLGHLLSSMGGNRLLFQTTEGTWLKFPDGSFVEIKEINVQFDLSGYITDFDMKIIHHKRYDIKEASVMPNRPYIYRGSGLYIKTVYPYPVKQVIVEISREPGAIPALIGGILFASGNIFLLMLKTKRPDRKE